MRLIKASTEQVRDVRAVAAFTSLLGKLDIPSCHAIFEISIPSYAANGTYMGSSYVKRPFYGFTIDKAQAFCRKRFTYLDGFQRGKNNETTSF